uniref:Uncharacterized protein n=1 Tax=Anguilla anguilla TaxID=7936 RepID=A0A0E9X1J5_ANGAN
MVRVSDLRLGTLDGSENHLHAVSFWGDFRHFKWCLILIKNLLLLINMFNSVSSVFNVKCVQLICLLRCHSLIIQMFQVINRKETAIWSQAFIISTHQIGLYSRPFAL